MNAKVSKKTPEIVNNSHISVSPKISNNRKLMEGQNHYYNKDKGDTSASRRFRVIDSRGGGIRRGYTDNGKDAKQSRSFDVSRGKGHLKSRFGDSSEQRKRVVGRVQYDDSHLNVSNLGIKPSKFVS